MDTTPELRVADVLAHWPFVRRHLNFARFPVCELVLEQLVLAQSEVGGAPVTLSHGQLVAGGLSPGAAGRARMVLRQLEDQRVVGSLAGAGRRPKLWTIDPSLVNWRAMPWVVSGRAVEAAIRRCSCRAARVVVARLPGQSGALSRGWGDIRLSDADHARRPGLLPVDTRDYDASRATTTRPDLVARNDASEPRDYDATSRPPSPFSLVPSEPLPPREGEEEEEEMLRTVLMAIRKRTGQVLYGSPREALKRAVAGADDRLAEVLAAIDASQLRGAPVLARAVVDLLAAPAPREVARPWDPDAGRRRHLERDLAALRRSADAQPDEIAAVEAELATLGE
jgi:hypothetical protein